MHGRKPFSALRRSAGEIKRYRAMQRLIPAVIGVIVALLCVVYVVSLLFNKYGSFTVSIRDVRDYRYALSLAEEPTFKNPTSRLNSKASQEITNIDGNTLPGDLNDIDGEHNGDNYVAYTFYLKNTGELTCGYKYSLVITRMTAGVEDAVRVRVYYNPNYYDAETDTTDFSGHYTDYAKPKVGGNGAPETDPEDRVMTNFESAGIIASGQTDDFGVGDITKITVVIWIEGNDPDCTDDILGGEFKVDMTFEITETVAS